MENPFLSADALSIDNRVVLEQIRRSLWDTSPSKIIRAGNDQPVGLRQFARRQCGIAKNTGAETRIDIFCQQINHAVIHDKFQPKLRMSIEKFAELGNNVKACERNGCQDP